MESIREELVFEIIGPDGFARLTAAFYEGVKADPILSPLYPQEDFAAAEQRLSRFPGSAFWRSFDVFTKSRPSSPAHAARSIPREPCC